jgi:hypothetical protein
VLQEIALATKLDLLPSLDDEGLTTRMNVRARLELQAVRANADTGTRGLEPDLDIELGSSLVPHVQPS